MKILLLISGALVTVIIALLLVKELIHSIILTQNIKLKMKKDNIYPGNDVFKKTGLSPLWVDPFTFFEWVYNKKEEEDFYINDKKKKLKKRFKYVIWYFICFLISLIVLFIIGAFG